MAMQELLRIIYVCEAAGEPDESALQAMLEQARENNGRRDITGLLLYRDGGYLQILEGPAARVERLVHRIREDSRQRGLRVVYRRPIVEREFGNWSMAYARPAERDFRFALDLAMQMGAPDGVSETDEARMLSQLMRLG